MWKENSIMYGESIMPNEIPSHMLLSLEDKLVLLERWFKRDIISDVEYGKLVKECFENDR